MKTLIKISIFSLVIIISSLLFSCTNDSEAVIEYSNDFDYDNSKVSTYRSIIDSINNYGYVPCFRLFKTTNFDFESFNINADESTFLKDSIAYYNSRKIFFNQNRDFLNWLLSFELDTIFDSQETQRTLWSPFMNPYSSNISACSIITTKSRQAINLIYGFLEGTQITCIECLSGNKSCALPKYKYVKEFLHMHRNKNIEQLRELWKPD
jgi:hypothetical protein